MCRITKSKYDARRHVELVVWLPTVGRKRGLSLLLDLEKEDVYGFERAKEVVKGKKLQGHWKL